MQPNIVNRSMTETKLGVGSIETCGKSATSWYESVFYLLLLNLSQPSIVIRFFDSLSRMYIWMEDEWLSNYPLLMIVVVSLYKVYDWLLCNAKNSINDVINQCFTLQLFFNLNQRINSKVRCLPYVFFSIHTIGQNQSIDRSIYFI